MNSGMFEEGGSVSLIRVLAMILVIAGTFVSVYGFCFAGKDAFDVMMVGGMLIGSGLTGKLVQKPMERVKS